MVVTFDPPKRALALKERQLDFADAQLVFDSGETATFEDERFDYRETRLITAGRLNGRMVLIVWTPRGADRHVISMRHCHAKEERKLLKRFSSLGRP